MLETSAGPITLELFPDRAPGHVRNFLRLSQAGVYDGMAFHRVARGFVIQTGFVPSRSTPLTEEQRSLITNLQPEFSDTPHMKGIVSMARGDDPASADTSFFIVTAGRAGELDGVYTVFGRVVDGIDAVDRIEATPGRRGDAAAARRSHARAAGAGRAALTDSRLPPLSPGAKPQPGRRFACPARPRHAPGSASTRSNRDVAMRA